MTERELVVSSGGAELAATLTLPAGEVRGGIVPLHPASDGSRHQFLFEHLAEVVGSQGVAVLRYDRRPSAAGEDIPLVVQADDALQALRTLRAQPEVGPAPLGLWGWSQGAWAAPLAASRLDDVSFLVLLAACGVSPAEQMRYGTGMQLRRNGFDDAETHRELLELRAALESAYRDGDRRAAAQATIDRYADRPWFPLAYVPRSLDPAATWPDLDFNPGPIFASVRCPVLLFYGEEDEWTPIEPSIEAWRHGAATAENDELAVCRLAGTAHAPTSDGVHDRDAISPEYTRTLLEWIDGRLGYG